MQTMLPTTSDTDAVYRKVLWRVMPLLMVAYIIAYIDRSNVGFAKLGFMRDLGFTDTMFGIGGSAFYAGYILFQVPSNLLLARIGFRPVLVTIMVLWAIFSGLLAFMHDAQSFYIARFLLGASEAGVSPGCLLFLTFWTPVARRSRFTALFMASLPLSGVISGPLSGLIMQNMDGLMGLHGWQWLFMVEGLPAPLFAVVILFCLPNTPSDASWLSPAERQVIENDIAADRAKTSSVVHGSFLDALRSPRFYLLAGMSIALVASAANVSFWLPTVIKSSGVTSVAWVGVLSAIPYLVGVIAQQWVARSADLRQERRWPAAICAMVSAIGWCVLSVVKTDATLSLIVLTLAAAGTFAAMGPFWSMPGLYLSKSAAAGGIALVSTFGGAGSVVSPIIVGWLNDVTHSLTAGQYYIAALLVVGAITTIAIGPHEAPKRKATSSG